MKPARVFHNLSASRRPDGIPRLHHESNLSIDHLSNTPNDLILLEEFRIVGGVVTLQAREKPAWHVAAAGCISINNMIIAPQKRDESVLQSIPDDLTAKENLILLYRE